MVSEAVAEFIFITGMVIVGICIYWANRIPPYKPSNLDNELQALLKQFLEEKANSLNNAAVASKINNSLGIDTSSDSDAVIMANKIESTAASKSSANDRPLATWDITTSASAFNEVESNCSEFIGTLKTFVEWARDTYLEGNSGSNCDEIYYRLPWRWAFKNQRNGRMIIKRIRKVYYNPDSDLYYGYMDSGENILDKDTLFPATDEIREVWNTLMTLAMMDDTERREAYTEIYKSVLGSYGFINEKIAVKSTEPATPSGPLIEHKSRS